MILANGVLRKIHSSQNGVDLTTSPNPLPPFEEINQAQRKGSRQTAHKHEHRSGM